MIPADLAARLRLLNEASFFNSEPPVPGLQRAREIQSQLPELVPGQRFFATLQRTLPDGTFRALVAGQQMTLALNTAAKSGDTLELEVSQVTPRAVFARIVGQEAAATVTASAQPALSQTGRLISFLLTGQPAAQPASLAANQPLLAAPPANGAQLAPLLRQALGQSGLFYESHQADWVLGRRDTASLTSEPQGQAQTRSTAPGASQAVTGQAVHQGVASPKSGAQSGQPAAAEGSERAAQARGAALADEAAPVRTAPIPDRLIPIVHQQLDALATQQYVWHGQAWPGQAVEWRIEDPERDDGSAEEETAHGWDSTLRLTLPRLGGVEAQLHLNGKQVALRLRADEADTLVALDAGAATLASALEAVDLRLSGLIVEPSHD
ncbi:flagellar hook-length control protein FliK [Thauera sp.]